MFNFRLVSVQLIEILVLAMFWTGCDSPVGQANRQAETKPVAAKEKVKVSQRDEEVAEPDSLYMDTELVESSADTSEWEVESGDEWEDTGDSEYEESEDYPDGDELSETEENLEVTQEKLLQAEVIPVRRPDFRNKTDSVLTQIENRISIQGDAVSKRIIVERWSSPVKFVGYKFNRKKLVVYGIGIKDAVRLYYYLNDYYLAINKELFFLDENFNLVPFSEVSDLAISNYLLADENRL